MAACVLIGSLFAAACGTDASHGADSDAAANAAADGAASDGGTQGPSFGDADLNGGGADACAAASHACPSTFTCGRYHDPCTGDVLACGAPCTSGEVCVTAADGASQSCQPKACSGQCGVVAVDSCGVAVDCGGCPSGSSCIANECTDAAVTTTTDSDACAPLTCTPDPQTTLCGTVTDGCGHTKSCSCPAGQTCSGGVCASPPPECSGDAGVLCGSVSNACGSANVACAACTGATECEHGVCTSCSPPACGTAKCGTVTNGCGPSVSCGTCPSSEICYAGACCTASTCGEEADAGLVTGCAPMNLGCGVQKSCAPCGEGQVCTNNACVACNEKTCADFGDAGCGHANGCGGTLDCCPSGTTCLGGSLCCAAGEVDYSGSCCKPACDPNQPAGNQTSCGQIIYCPSSGSGAPR